MNRHLTDLSATADHAPLGTPIRPAATTEPKDGDRKPHSPGYEARTRADGGLEIRPTSESLAEMLSRPLQPPKKADAESILVNGVPWTPPVRA